MNPGTSSPRCPCRRGRAALRPAARRRAGAPKIEPMPAPDADRNGAPRRPAVRGRARGQAATPSAGAPQPSAPRDRPSHPSRSRDRRGERTLTSTVRTRTPRGSWWTAEIAASVPCPSASGANLNTSTPANEAAPRVPWLPGVADWRHDDLRRLARAPAVCACARHLDPDDRRCGSRVHVQAGGVLALLGAYLYRDLYVASTAPGSPPSPPASTPGTCIRAFGAPAHARKAARYVCSADAFNHMLDRLTEAFAGQRAFVADASHELRTPLTVIRGQLEVLAAQQHPPPEELRRVERLVQAEIARITPSDRRPVAACQDRTGEFPAYRADRPAGIRGRALGAHALLAHPPLPARPCCARDVARRSRQARPSPA